MQKKILIIKLSSLGDVIFTLPLAKALKEAGYEVSWLVSDKGLKVIQNNPYVDKTFYIPSNYSIKEFIHTIKALRKEKFDISIDAQMMFKSLFLSAFCGAKRRITSKNGKELSFLGANELIEGVSYHPDIHIVMNYLKFAKYLGCEPEPEKIKALLPDRNESQIKKADDLLSDIDTSKKIIAIAPATTWDNKHWNKDYWCEVVKYTEPKYNLIFTGSKKDSDLIEYISKGKGINLAGKTDILELAEVFSRSDLVISQDSGSAYLAWAAEKPKIITIFTCTPPEILAPYGDSNKYAFLGGNSLSCQPCFKRKCRLKSKNQCTFYPAPEDVISKAEEFLH